MCGTLAVAMLWHCLGRAVALALALAVALALALVLAFFFGLAVVLPWLSLGLRLPVVFARGFAAALL